MSRELHRHVHAVVADLAAEYGEVDLVGRRIECPPEARDALVDAFDAFGVVGGAGVRVQADDRVLLVRYAGADGWLDPGDSRRPGESYRECARRAVHDVTDAAVDLVDLAQVHLLYMEDWTDRGPVPNPHVVYDGRLPGDDRPTVREDSYPDTGVSEVRWLSELPEDLLYEELAELPLLDG